MLHRATASLFVLLAFGCSSGEGGDGADRATYLTLMGDDTLAIEWMEFGDRSVDVRTLIRGSRTTFGEYRFALSEAGEATTYSENVYLDGWGVGDPVRSSRIEGGEAGRELVVTRDGEERRSGLEEEPGSVPFIDMLHWPFEAALRWHASQGTASEEIATFTGRGMRFGWSANDDGTWSLVHPSRGPSTVRIDSEGRILALDGTGSTRAYDLRRLSYDSLDQAAMAQAFRDRPLGELSGRGQIDDTVAGVHFTGHYGTPRRRGRDIFGGLLAYGVWWRTGANQATHLAFDEDIVIDGELVPTGEYTLSSIPEEDGGVLIINTRTGQGGQSYDESLDQTRVQLRRDTLDERVEVFEIRVVEADDGGRIELRWDDTVYWVPFTRP